jgi:tryptophan synthase alpha chain
MSRIQAAFPKDRPAVIAYVMAGDPSLEASFAHAKAILAEADALEIGVPYSDPVADGPVIERAGVRSLARGTTLTDCLALARRLRAASPKPILLMTYYNPVLQRGLARFAQDARDAGVDGVILPDAPLEESGPAREALEKEGVALGQLASPASPPERLRRLAQATRGFLYVVSSFGVTGAREGLAPETADLVARVKALGVPFAVGFGVARPEDVRALAAAGAEGVVVGSAIVGRIERGETPEQVAGFVRSLMAR